MPTHEKSVSESLPCAFVRWPLVYNFVLFCSGKGLFYVSPAAKRYDV